jgi:hypothetical protein
MKNKIQGGEYSPSWIHVGFRPLVKHVIPLCMDRDEKERKKEVEIQYSLWMARA